jgi:FAD/FMN-containing dehydrogenase
MMPLGVVVPKSRSGIEAAIGVAQQEGIQVLARGVGASQCGQTANNALAIDNSIYLNDILEIDVENRLCAVRPGIVLDELNRAFKPHELSYPVDVSMASRATIGGMAVNNSCRDDLSDTEQCGIWPFRLGLQDQVPIHRKLTGYNCV